MNARQNTRQSAPRHWGVVPAAGVGQRMSDSVPKQYLPLCGATVLEHTLRRMLSWGFLEGIALALAPGDTRFQSLPLAADARLMTAEGGEQRSDSVLSALRTLEGRADSDDWIWVHDGVRPCVSSEDVASLQAGLVGEEVGAVLALPVADTVKLAIGCERIDETLDRSQLWLAQTPQVFPYGRLRQALDTAVSEGWPVTDESSAVERLGLQPKLVAGSPGNLKITRPGDLAIAAGILERLDMMRVGHGYDVHAFDESGGEGNGVVLGGVRIPHDRGLVAHSDGDVLLHALCDALLGAVALGDIGGHFPDSDPQYADADSRALLRTAFRRVQSQGYGLVNADMTIVAQAPVIAPHIEAMRANIAADLGCQPEQVNIKATTTERLGFIGRSEGIAAHAVALLQLVG